MKQGKTVSGRHGAFSLHSRFELAFLALAFIVSSPMRAVQRWERAFGDQRDDKGYDVHRTSDGGYIVGGYRWPFPRDSGYFELALLKLDSMGDTAWSRSYRPQSCAVTFAYSLAVTADHGYLAAGYALTAEWPDTARGYVIRADSVGDLLWAWRDTVGRTSFTCVEATADGGAVLCGRTEDDESLAMQALAVRLDCNGRLLWRKLFGGWAGDLFEGVAVLPDGGFVFCGYWSSNPDNICEGWLVRTDSSGETLWARTYDAGLGGGFAEVRIAPDGELVLVGSLFPVGPDNEDYWLVRTDSLGILRLDRSYGGAGLDWAAGLSLAQDGGYWLAGQSFSYSSGGSDAWLVRTDHDGGVEWTRNYGGRDFDIAYAVEETPDGGCVMSGSTWSFGAGANDIYVIKTDRTGSSAIGFSGRVADGTEDNRVRLVIAGPTAQVAGVRYFLPKADDPALELFTATGTRVRRVALGEKAPGWHDASLGDFPCSGTCFIRLSCRSGTATAKTVSLGPTSESR